jgi:uncharacterized RDD family membrane protein YckC
MKCPKCGYLGFEHVERCRNCGYDFAFSSQGDSLELPLNVDLAAPLDERRFPDVDVSPAAIRAVRGLSEEALRDRSTDLGQPPAHGELPLFGAAIPDDLPLITRPSPPRPPLAVRRATPDTPRLRSAPRRSANLELGLEPLARAHAPGAALQSTEMSARSGEDATIGARLVAVVTDLLILAAIDLVVLYFTMQICGIGIDELGILPRVPLFAFLLVQNGGYLVAFTAGGQTLGKMLTGIKVVCAEPPSPPDLGRAFVRELVWLLLAAPAGLGLLTVLSRDRRGVHDRFAGTRVIRASL